MHWTRKAGGLCFERHEPIALQEPESASQPQLGMLLHCSAPACRYDAVITASCRVTPTNSFCQRPSSNDHS